MNGTHTKKQSMIIQEAKHYKNNQGGSHFVQFSFMLLWNRCKYLLLSNIAILGYFTVLNVNDLLFLQTYTLLGPIR